MIRKEDNLLLGTIARTHGTKGSVLLRLRNIKPEEIKNRDSVFVDIDGLLVPFFIVEFKANSDSSVIVKFDDIDSEQSARIFSGSEVYVAPAQIKRNKKQPDIIPSVIGYRVIDKKHGFIGIAGARTGVSGNPLLEVKLEGKVYLVPVHEDIFLEINDNTREILIDTPEGLLEI